MEPQSQFIKLEQTGSQMAVTGNVSIKRIKIEDNFIVRSIKREGDEVVVSKMNIKITGLNTSADFDSFAGSIAKLGGIMQNHADGDMSSLTDSERESVAKVLEKYTDYKDFSAFTNTELMTALLRFMDTSLVKEYLKILNPGTKKAMQGARM